MALGNLVQLGTGSGSPATPYQFSLDLTNTIGNVYVLIWVNIAPPNSGQLISVSNELGQSIADRPNFGGLNHQAWMLVINENGGIFTISIAANATPNIGVPIRTGLPRPKRITVDVANLGAGCAATYRAWCYQNG